MPANITVTATETGWHVEGVAPGSPHRFTADLGACDCDPKTNKKFKASLPCDRVPASHRNGSGSSGGYHASHVETFVKRVAATYQGKTPVPAIPPLLAAAA